MANEPHLGKLRPGPVLGAFLYGLLALSLAVALGCRASGLPEVWQSTAPVAFGLFLVLFVIYRFVLIRAGRYPFGRALFQVGAGILFFAVLLHRGKASKAQGTGDIAALLQSHDPLVRQLACEVGRYRRPVSPQAMASLKAHAAHDTTSVQAECSRTVRALDAGR